MKILKYLHKLFIGFLAPIIVSAVFLRLSFTQFMPGTLVFFALVPLCVAARKWSRLKTGFGFFLTGLLFYFMLLHWIDKQTFAGMIGAVIYFSLFFAPIGFLMGNNAQNLLSFGYKIFLSFIWCVLEFIRAEFSIGFPWGLMGVALHKEAILIQSASIAGIFGITFFIVLVNFFISSTFLYAQKNDTNMLNKLKYVYIHFSFLLFLFSFIIIHGETEFYQIIRKKSTPVHIGLIQPNVKSEQKWDIRQKNKLMGHYKAMSLGLKNIDLLIWPESVLPGELLYDSKLFSVLMEIIEQRQVSLLLGSGNMSFRIKKDKNRRVYKSIYYNSVYLVGKDKKIKDIYNKIKLVPFGEYIPFKEYFPNLKHLTPIQESYTPGARFTVFSIKKEDKEIKFSSIICIEDIYPGFVRQFVLNGARFIVNVTNDGWYSKTPCAYQHFAHSVFRAVENRVPLIRCANTGVSAVISPLGDVQKAVSEGKDLDDIAGSLKEKIFVNLNTEPSFYTKHGDVFIIFAGIYIFLYLFKNKIYSIFRIIKRRYF